jgi:hypothetical protein
MTVWGRKMSRLPKEDEILALELEIAGLDVELREKRMLARSYNVAIEALEAQRLSLTYRISYIRSMAITDTEE